MRAYAFNGISLLSKLITFWTRGPVSHIAVEVDGRLIEAWKFPDGLRWGYSDLSNHTPGTPYEVWELKLKPEEEEVCRAFWTGLAKRKAPYDLMGVFGFVVKATTGDKEKWFCSEGAIYPLVKVKRWDRIRPWRVSPTRFVEIIQAAGARLVEAGRC